MQQQQEGQEAQADEFDADTVDSFCTANRIGRSTLYQFWQEGRGPRFFYIGSTRRISKQAGREWRRSLEREAELNPVKQPSVGGYRPRRNPRSA